MKNWSIWHWLVFIALVGMTSFFGAGLIKAIADGGIGSSAVAAWTQAIGAVIAIVVAVWVMRYQTNRAREERIEKQRFEDERKVKTLLAFYEEIIFSVSPFCSEINRIDAIELPPSSYTQELAIGKINSTYLADLKDALAEIPLWEIPDDGLAIQFTQTMRKLTDAIQVAESARHEIARYNDDLAEGIYQLEQEEAKDHMVRQTKEAVFSLHDSIVSAIERCRKLLGHQ